MDNMSIGEVRTIKIKAIEDGEGCEGCIFNDCGCQIDPFDDILGDCVKSERKDGKHVIFVEVE